MSSTAAIKAEQLTVKKDSKIILDNLSFTIEKGSITGLIGPSGSGKTTLMRAIVGVQKYQGELSVEGKKAGSRTLRREIGYVTQSPAVYPDLSVYQNLRYFATLTRSSKKAVEMIIDSVRLIDQRDQLVGSLSGGQKARVSLAVALLGEPKLLVLDEPTVGLDPVLRNELWEVFAHLARQGRTLLVSSHVMDEAERCDNLLLLRDGKLMWNDTRGALLAHTHKHNVGDAFVAMIEQESK